MYTVPATWKFHGSSNNGNTVQFVRPGHTAAAPRLAIFKRTIPTYQNGRWSRPSYDVKIVSGVLDTDGNPVAQRINVGTDGVTWPMAGAAVSAAVAEAISDFTTVISQADFALAVQSQSFPTVASA